MKNICIDLGGTNIKAGIIENEKLVYSDAIPSESDGSFLLVMGKLEDLIADMLTKSGSTKNEISGIGMCMPGIINVDQNKVISVNAKHIEAVDFNFNQWAQETYGVPLVMENDARAALAGEWQNGVGKGYNDIVMMTIGTGIGGAAMINGELLYGKHYQAGCLGGHSTIKFDGRNCNCGSIGCVETLASSWAIKKLVPNTAEEKEFLEQLKGDINYRILFEKKREGHPIAEAICELSLKAWSAGVVNLVHAYDPDVVIISGGVMKSKDDILPFISEYVDNHAWTPAHKVKVIASEETNNIALWGINYLLHKHIVSN